MYMILFLFFDDNKSLHLTFHVAYMYIHIIIYVYGCMQTSIQLSGIIFSVSFPKKGYLFNPWGFTWTYGSKGGVVI